MERVEILRGPQGTLYGRNAIGGTVNVISKRPTEEFYAEVRGIAENYDYTDLQMAVSGPDRLDNLRFRSRGYARPAEGLLHQRRRRPPSEGSKRNEYQAQFQLEADLGENAEWWSNT